MKPKIAPFDFGGEPVNFEDSSSITCLVLIGDVPVDIEWLFNDYPINSYSGITIVKGGKKASILTIESVNGRHAGNYSCRARNTAGSVSHSALLEVNGLGLQFFHSLLLYKFILSHC